ncbi:MAG: FAD-dependent oxidoreductase [Rhodobacteraceae bacterium]|nr:FAD-dependent oxidoreductase [Paracoccaceae bacterium]
MLPKDRLAVVGGGPAGAHAALALRAAHPKAAVILLERDPARLGRSLDAAPARFDRPGAGVSLETLRQAGVDVVLDDVSRIDWVAARLALFSGRHLAFDRLFVAPGTAPRAESIPGLDAHARHAWPAAWGNPREARRLTAQLAALPDKGHVVLRLPPMGQSHPQAALDRALTLARHLARQRPAARLTVLDESPDSRLAARFAQHAADRHLAGQTLWLTAKDGATVRAVDASRGWIDTDAGRLIADVVNFIPPLEAGAIARTAGLTDASGWCPCTATGHSTHRAEALILGDARKGAERTVSAALMSARV